MAEQKSVQELADRWLALQTESITAQAKADRAKAALEHARIVMAAAAPAAAAETAGADPGVIKCEECGEPIKDTRRNNGSIWTAAEKAEYSRKKNRGRALCYKCDK
jgi:hypothetical protein